MLKNEIGGGGDQLYKRISNNKITIKRMRVKIKIKKGKNNFLIGGLN